MGAIILFVDGNQFWLGNGVFVVIIIAVYMVLAITYDSKQQRQMNNTSQDFEGIIPKNN